VQHSKLDPLPSGLGHLLPIPGRVYWLPYARNGQIADVELRVPFLFWWRVFGTPGSGFLRLNRGAPFLFCGSHSARTHVYVYGPGPSPAAAGPYAPDPIFPEIPINGRNRRISGTAGNIGRVTLRSPAKPEQLARARAPIERPRHSLSPSPKPG